MRSLCCEGGAFLALVQRLLFPEKIGDVDRGADVTEKIVLPVIAWRPARGHPTKLSIVPSQPVLNDKWLAAIESDAVTLHRVLDVVRMDIIRPADAELLLHGAPGKVKPRFIKKRRALIRTG